MLYAPLPWGEDCWWFDGKIDGSGRGRFSMLIDQASWSGDYVFVR